MSTTSPLPAAPHRPTSRPLRIVARANPDKIGPLADALRHAGHELVESTEAHGDVAFTDIQPTHGRVKAMMDRVGRTVLYPHSPQPLCHHDGIWPTDPSVIATFVVGHGSREVLEASGFDREIRVIGWPFGEVRPFRSTAGRRVLFAPHHPDRLGNISPRIQADNRRILLELLDAGFDVKVRHLGSLRGNGLQRLPGVEFVHAGHRSAAVARTAEDDILDADVVVANGTFAHRSVALGTPTVMFGQNRWPGDTFHPRQHAYYATWSRWEHLLRYPFDADGDLAGAVRQAATDEATIATWRHRFIPEPLDATDFVRQFEQVVR